MSFSKLGRRKSLFADIIYEISDDDMSPENEEGEQQQQNVISIDDDEDEAEAEAVSQSTSQGVDADPVQNDNNVRESSPMIIRTDSSEDGSIGPWVRSVLTNNVAIVEADETVSQSTSACLGEVSIVGVADENSAQSSPAQVRIIAIEEDDETHEAESLSIITNDNSLPLIINDNSSGEVDIPQSTSSVVVDSSSVQKDENAENNENRTRNFEEENMPQSTSSLGGESSVEEETRNMPQSSTSVANEVENIEQARPPSGDAVDEMIGEITQSDKTDMKITENTVETNETVSCNETVTESHINSTSTTLEHAIMMSDPPAEKEEPNISIVFNDLALAEEWKPKFKTFIESCSELEVLHEDDMNIKIRETIRVGEKRSADEDDLDLDEPTKKKRRKRGRSKKKKSDFFVVDSNPFEDDNSTILTKYSSQYEMNKRMKGNQQSDGKAGHSGNSCFNCGRGHTLRECPAPRNYQKIHAAMQKFREKRQKRYYAENDAKYGHLEPGKISDKLRHALGLRRHELPSYVYRMRKIGYPPGWLNTANRFYNQDLEVYDKDGNAMEKDKPCRALIPEKIVTYPGFNAPIGPGMRDDYKYYNVPPWSRIYDKEAMIQYFEREFQEKQERAKAKSSTITSAQVSDMDVPSPSSIDLEKLEKQKARLLGALQETGDSTPASDVGSEKEDEPNEGEEIVQDNLIAVVKTEENVESDDLPGPSNAASNKPGIIKTTLGTPILPSISPYKTLPSAEKFREGISPVINFENLPTYQPGKYKQIKELLTNYNRTKPGNKDQET